jgi:hypothetical protein
MPPKRWSKTPASAIALLVWAALLCQCARADDAARRLYLDGLVRPDAYAAAKNAFIIQNLRRGERRTLLDVAGCGSVRHLWTTWARSFDANALAVPRMVVMRVYVDGEARPSIEGTIEEVVGAAERTGDRYVPQPVFVYEGAYNLYLPIFFRRSTRIEIEALEDLDEFYAQVDYRTMAVPESGARLVGERDAGGLHLRYVGPTAPAFDRAARRRRVAWQTEALVVEPGRVAEVAVRGPATIRALSLAGDALDDADLSIWWDRDAEPAVSAPVRYLFADFRTLAIDSEPTLRTCYFPMPFRERARIRVRNRADAPHTVILRYALDRATPLPADVEYFHARFHEQEATLAYRDCTVLATSGEGHFVGAALFDTGHNHGGGDTALVDAATTEPRVLHGIAGEDYFSFAWHKTGAMHAFAGAPAHERRYRFHLENPYPFHRALRFTFGVFAGQHPKSVAFWYQRPAARRATPWRAVDAPWKVFGPVGDRSALSGEVDERGVETTVPVAKPERFEVRWEDATMEGGFLDLTHHFRHYAMTSQGTGFVAGASWTRAVAYVYSPVAQTVAAILGHDDAVAVDVDGARAVDLPASSGFRPSRISLRLHAGWNTLGLAIENRENTTWRWYGCSLALRADTPTARAVRFGPAR